MRGKKLQIPDEPEKPVTIVIVGAGARGIGYAEFSKYFPKWLKVVGVADPLDFKRNSLAKEYNVPEEYVFADWKEMVELPKFADAVAICTTDQDHIGPAVAFAQLKYHILLEKPMAVSMDDCESICSAISENEVIFAVCHVMRYTPYTRELIKILDSREVGQIINIQHLEPIGFWHFAHSFVRGNWHNEDASTFSLMSKSCHDLDYLPFLMDTKCKRISSFGSLTHFKNENKPKEAGNAKNCFECPYESNCPYSAKKIYTEPFVKEGLRGWPVSIVQPNGPIDIENLSEALLKTDYGRCVYELDNDVCDHQVVNLEFENGTTASFTMVAFTEAICERKTKIFGTRGEIEGDGVDKIKIYDFATRTSRIVQSKIPSNQPQSGHFGGDFALLQDFLYAVSTGNKDYILSGPQETLDSHIYVFAAEHARRTGTVVDIEEFKKEKVRF